MHISLQLSLEVFGPQPELLQDGVQGPGLQVRRMPADDRAAAGQHDLRMISPLGHFELQATRCGEAAHGGAAPNAASKVARKAMSTSAIETGMPRRASEVTPCSRMPQGTMPR